MFFGRDSRETQSLHLYGTALQNFKTLQKRLLLYPQHGRRQTPPKYW
jgi:hypothetical protein